MVYRIWPAADFVNRGIDLEYEKLPSAKRSWDDYLFSEELMPKESAPTLILSNRPVLPAAFEIGADVWCVSAQVRDLMHRLFASQVAFYEVPAVFKAARTPLPSTYFVSFANFYSWVDWEQSATEVTMRTHAGQTFEIVSLADKSKTVFQSMPRDRAVIWIEKKVKVGNRLYSPGSYPAYATNAATLELAGAFPGHFELIEFGEALPYSSSPTAP